MALTSLVVVLVVHVAAISAVEAEGNPPVAIDGDGPYSFPLSFEWMKPKSGRVEIPDSRRGLEPGQNPTDLRNMVWVQPSGMPSLEEPL